MDRAGVMHRKTGRMFLCVFAWMMVLLLGSAVPSRGAIIDRADEILAAQELAAAMDIPAAHLEFATAGFSAIRGKGVVTGNLGQYFPTQPPQGGSFAILSTGAVGSADNRNLNDATSEVLGRRNDPQGRDLIEIELKLRPPNGAVCLAFDYAFYSEEYPERIGRGFNDTFTATLGEFVLNTFASSAVDTAAFSGSTGTTYDGGTGLLTAVGRLNSVGTPKLTLAIVDAGDSRYDSAVFLDRFRWLFDPACETGPPPAPRDSDGDALLDAWETHGIDTDNDGVIDLDLKELGADPFHKDIFVEADYMLVPDNYISGIRVPGHSHQLSRSVVEALVWTFFAAPVPNPDGIPGIHLHLDAGPRSIMDPATGRLWGLRSRSNPLFHDDELGSCAVVDRECRGPYNWTEFDQIKNASFTPGRARAFHYAVLGHRLGASGHSGISRGILASDFIVTLGGFAGNQTEQAGTFMHELGHNLALLHGGGDGANYKPNYLSVMNYVFQFSGLLLHGFPGKLDYSFEALPPLVETNLVESMGLNGSHAIDPYGTFYSCGELKPTALFANGPIDWNCNGNPFEAGVTADVNRRDAPGLLSTLTGFDDWANLRFGGGAVGDFGEIPEPPIETEVDEITDVEAEQIPRLFGVKVSGPAVVAQLAGTTRIYELEVRNLGENADIYQLQAVSEPPWADASSLPATLSLAPGQAASVSIPLTIPAGTPANEIGELILTATSTQSELITDSATTQPYVPENPPVAHAGADQHLECSSRNGTPVTLDGSGSQAPSGGMLVYIWTGPFPEGAGRVEGVSPTVTLPLGIHTITLRVNDGIVDSYPDTVVVTVLDTTPPTISAALSPTLLWPANHKMRPITARVVATDICSVPTVALTSLTSSEPDDAKGNGDGNTVGDIQGAALGTPDFLFSLRAERAGSGPGRIYTTLYTATDGSGNQASDQDQVQVPHSQKK